MKKLLASLLLFCTIATGAPLGGDFQLTDQNGKAFALHQLRGKVVLLFFGYTHCPDLCPTELGHIATVLRRLDKDGDPVRGVFITLDPARDDVATIKDYVRYFDERLIGLTGTAEAIARVAARYQIRYQRHPQTHGDYSIDHSANLYIIDRSGTVAAMIPYGLPIEHTLSVVQRIMRKNPVTDRLGQESGSS